MTNQAYKTANLAGWLEENCGEIQAQDILNYITAMQHKTYHLECMEIMLLAEVIHGYRKEMLRQIKEYKALRAQEYAQVVASFHVRKELKSIKEAITSGIACWKDLRDTYFFERTCYMERCKWPHSAAVCLSNPTYEQSPSQTA